MKILVTGGAGYIGSHTVVSLIEAGHTPVIVDSFINSSKDVIDALHEITSTKISYYEGDVCDVDFLVGIFEKEKALDGIIHFAAYKSVGESVTEPLKYYRNNIDSLLSVLEVALQHNVTNIVFSSSATVYGAQEKNPLTETMTCNPTTNPYGTTKVIAENILRDLHTSKTPLKSIALRYFNPIGAHPSHLIGELPLGTPANLVPYLTQATAKLRQPLTVHGNDYPTHDGTGVRDYIHVVDLANAHVKALEYLTEQKKSSFYDIFNVGTGNGTSVLDLIKIFEEVTDEKVPYIIGSRRPGDIATCWADTTKISHTLQWQSHYSISEALLHAWQWQKHISHLKQK